MAFRLLVAERNAEFLQTLEELTGAVRGALPIDLEVREVVSAHDTSAVLREWRPDALLLDWNIAAEQTVPFLGELQVQLPGIRIMVMLPETAGEYRRAVWAAGACAGIPRDRLDAECLATALCIMQRAKLRETALRNRVIEACPSLAEVLG